MSIMRYHLCESCQERKPVPLIDMKSGKCMWCLRKEQQEANAAKDRMAEDLVR